jgi:hypothetical protein
MFHPINGLEIASILPRYRMGPHTGSSTPWGNTGDDCAICIAEMALGDEVSEMPVCRHTFHLECLTKWLETKVAALETGRCPACNIVLMSPVFQSPQVTDEPQQVTDTPRMEEVLAPQTRPCTNYNWNSIVLVASLVLVCCSLVTIVLALIEIAKQVF